MLLNLASLTYNFCVETFLLYIVVPCTNDAKIRHFFVCLSIALDELYISRKKELLLMNLHDALCCKKKRGKIT
jgi:hypothetical protein